MNKLKLLLSFCALLFCINAQAQQLIKGTVGDKSSSLPGVNISIKGTTKGTISNMTGEYKITANKGDVLKFTFIGYKTQEVIVANQTTVNITLEYDSEVLDEIVVTGYGTQDARKVSSSISTIKSEDISNMNTPTLENALQGKSAGLQVTATSGEPGATARMRIRGSNSLLGNNEPLIVLDGFPLNTDPAPTGGGLDATSSSPLSFINMDDVESVQVLKDASATAIYGARGANGVILITTKKGIVAKKPNINFSVDAFTSLPVEYPKMMNSQQFFERGNTNNIFGGDRNPADYQSVTWMDEILQQSYGQNYKLSISGGTQQNRYLISGSYSKNDGIIIGSGFDRATLLINSNNKLTDKIKLNSTMNYSRSSVDRAAGSNGTAIQAGGIIFNALRGSPSIPVGTDISFPFIDPNPGNSYPANPYLQLTEQSDHQVAERLFITSNLVYQMHKDLNLTVMGGFDTRPSTRERYMSRQTIGGYAWNGRGILVNGAGNTFIGQTFLTYKKSIAKHNLTTVVGVSRNKMINKSSVNNVSNFPSDQMEVYGMGYGIDPQSYTHSRTDRDIQSLFFRGNYNYHGKYMLSFSGRLDGSSVFPTNNKYAFFPAVSVAWNIKREEFMKGINAISSLKVRAGYGETGSQAIRPYQSIPQYGLANYISSDAQVSGVKPTSMGNPNLIWETTAQFNGGVDLKMLKGRVGLVFDYYNKETTDLLVPFKNPGSAGFDTFISNRGSVRNEGIELTLTATPVKSPSFQWNMNVNYSRNRSKILDLGGLDFIPGPHLDPNWLKENITTQFVGQPISMFYGYEVEGLIQKSDFDGEGNPTFALHNGVTTLGAWKFKDNNGDGEITSADRTIIGDPNPDFTFGFNNTFKYRRLSLSVFIQGSYGNELFNVSNLYTGKGYVFFNQTADWYENRWIAADEANGIAGNEHNDPNYPSEMSNVYIKPTNINIEDGSYIRLKNVALQYNVDMSRVKAIRSLQLSFSTTNLLTITNYSGMDPEVNLFGNRDDALGIDFFSYPNATTYTVGLKVGL